MVGQPPLQIWQGTEEEPNYLSGQIFPSSEANRVSSNAATPSNALMGNVLPNANDPALNPSQNNGISTTQEIYNYQYGSTLDASLGATSVTVIADASFNPSWNFGIVVSSSTVRPPAPPIPIGSGAPATALGLTGGHLFELLDTAIEVFIPCGTRWLVAAVFNTTWISPATGNEYTAGNWMVIWDPYRNFAGNTPGTANPSNPYFLPNLSYRVRYDCDNAQVLGAKLDGINSVPGSGIILLQPWSQPGWLPPNMPALPIQGGPVEIWDWGTPTPQQGGGSTTLGSLFGGYSPVGGEGGTEYINVPIPLNEITKAISGGKIGWILCDLVTRWTTPANPTPTLTGLGFKSYESPANGSGGFYPLQLGTITADALQYPTSSEPLSPRINNNQGWWTGNPLDPLSPTPYAVGPPVSIYGNITPQGSNVFFTSQQPLVVLASTTVAGVWGASGCAVNHHQFWMAVDPTTFNIIGSLQYANGETGYSQVIWHDWVNIGVTDLGFTAKLFVVGYRPLV